MRFFQERRELLQTARAIVEHGLVTGTSGNVSVRVPGGLIVTPSGMPYATMTTEDLVEMRMDASLAPGQLVPSTEWRFHRDIYAQRPEAGAVVHAHPVYATALACLRRSIPAFHYMIAVAGGHDIRCAEYATFGTEELSRSALAALDGRRACLLANHGLIAVGESLERALYLAEEVEALAGQYVRALQVGTPHVLDAAEMERVLERFRTYGRQPGKRRF